MTLLKNFVLFLLVFLPVVALLSMAAEGMLGDRAGTSPEWKVGWNPIMWLIMTAPWLLPTAAVVPVLHFLARVLRTRLPRATVRTVMLAASPALFSLAVFALWGRGGLDLGFVVPVVLSAVAYGAALRIHESPGHLRSAA